MKHFVIRFYFLINIPFCCKIRPMILPGNKRRNHNPITIVSESIPKPVNNITTPSKIKIKPKTLTKIPSFNISYPFANLRRILPETSIEVPRTTAKDVKKRISSPDKKFIHTSHLLARYLANLSTACGRFFRPSPRRKWLWESSYIVPGRSKTPAFLTRPSQKSSTFPLSRRGTPIEPAVGRFQVKRDE